MKKTEFPKLGRSSNPDPVVIPKDPNGRTKLITKVSLESFNQYGNVICIQPLKSKTPGEIAVSLLSANWTLTQHTAYFSRSIVSFGSSFSCDKDNAKNCFNVGFRNKFSGENAVVFGNDCSVEGTNAILLGTSDKQLKGSNCVGISELRLLEREYISITYFECKSTKEKLPLASFIKVDSKYEVDLELPEVEEDFRMEILTTSQVRMFLVSDVTINGANDPVQVQVGRNVITKTKDGWIV